MRTDSKRARKVSPNPQASRYSDSPCALSGLVIRYSVHMFRVISGLIASWLAVHGAACTKPIPVEFSLMGPDDKPVVGAHARIIALDAGAPLPVTRHSLAEAGLLQSGTGTFSDERGHLVLRTLPKREHLIEIERPVFGSFAAEEYPPMLWWVYRAGPREIIPLGDLDRPFRLERLR